MALYPPRQPVKLSPRVDFNPEWFRQSIFQVGARVIWEQAHQCPCSRKVADLTSDMTDFLVPEGYVVTGEAAAECPRCTGVGFFLTDPQEVPVIIHSMRDVAKRFARSGEYEEGTASVTFLPEHKLSLGHRLTLTKSVHNVREARRRSALVVEALRFPIADQTLDLQTGQVTARVLWAQKATNNVSNTTTDKLVEGTDFTVTVDGKIDWTLGIANGRAPVLNAYYTISYLARPRYMITDLSHAVRDTYVQNHAPAAVFSTMPIQGMARLEYLGQPVGP